MDLQISLPSGDAVRVRDIVIFVGGATNMTLMIQEDDPAFDGNVFARRAVELANHFDAFARERRLGGIHVAVCVNEEQLASRQRPAALYLLHRDGDAWTLRTSTPR